MKSWIVVIATLLSARVCVGQQFSVSAYRQFLNSHENMSTAQLLSDYPAGVFKAGARTDYNSAAYFDSIAAQYNLTSGEKSLIAKNGFMVTERLDDSTFGYSFGNAFADIYHKDLPVFMSTDAILHAIHVSYNSILSDVEGDMLVGEVDTLLTRLEQGIPRLASDYSSNPEMEQMFRDVDVYLSVPMILLDSTAAPVYSEDSGTIDSLLSLISKEQPHMFDLFSSTPRLIDFSQFTPRGHYAQSPVLTGYFKAMMWLGRVGLDFTEPTAAAPALDAADLQRQTIDAVLVSQLVDSSGSLPLYNKINSILKFFVGDQDNVTLRELDSLEQDVHLSNAAALLDSLRWRQFQDTLLTKPYSSQKTLSQILMTNAMNPVAVEPPSAFMLFGQRFVIDSYIFGNVVFNRIVYNGTPVKRMMPSPLDVLFAEGNSAAAQLLLPQLNEYHYASNLAALRYLVNSYTPGFWQTTLYNSWSNIIRSLIPPASRDSLPAFMQTAAWWQEKMNTQLASWAELRHDNLLYAKESYTAEPTCSYPESYVEPIPKFFQTVEAYAEDGENAFPQSAQSIGDVGSYFSNLKVTADTLEMIANDELSNTPLDSAETTFLKNMLTVDHSEDCGAAPYDGWYPQLFFGSQVNTSLPFQKDLVVADVHTDPALGQVLEVGTGPINMAVIVANVPGGGPTAFVGPVMSFYKDQTENFERLTDQEWQTAYNIAPSLRPSWVNNYLTNSEGVPLAAGESLITGIDQNSPGSQVPDRFTLYQNYPNPFNPSTIIAFKVPQVLSNTYVSISVYNTLGEKVRTLLSGDLVAGNYTVRWDGKNEDGAPAASGVYFCRLTAKGVQLVKKMVLIR